MKQVLHIFQKDVRHYWREGTVAVALMAAFAWNDMRSWAGEGSVGYSGIGGLLSDRFLLGLVEVLLPIAWAFVIVRVIQGESLVGDRQFWITRPYEWKNLLAAKVLFVLVFVNFPLLIADIFLLAKAGFPPTRYLAGLLWMQVLMTLFPILLIAVLATVTANILQVGLAVLVIALYLIGMISLSEQIPSSSFSSSIADSAQTVLLIGTSVAVVLLQYARRETGKSRWLIIGFAAVLLLILVATPYQAVVAHQYPMLGDGQQPPVQLALLPAEKPADTDIANQEKEVQIQIPLSVSSISEESIVVLSGVMVRIESPDGVSWNSGWRSSGTSLYPEQTETHIDFSLKKNFFERVKSLHVKTVISLAFTVFDDQNRRRFVTPDGEFVMPDVGLCSTEAGYTRGIQCRAALRTPSSLLITSDLSETTCPAREGESRAKPGEVARDWHQNSYSGPAEFGISPLKSVSFYLRTSSNSKARTIDGICPGTPLVLSKPEPVRRARTQLEFNGLQLADYRLKSISFGLWK